MTKTFSMVSDTKYYLSANEGIDSKLVTCFIGGFTLKRKFQTIAYIFNGSKHIYWILDLDNEVHSIWTSNLQRSKG